MVDVMKASDVLTYRKGKAPKNNATQRIGQELPYLTPEFLRGNDNAQLAFVDASSVIVQDGDLILLWDGSNAGEFFIGRKGILSSTMVVLQSRLDFDGQFLFFALKVHETFLKAQTSGSGIPHVDKEIFGNLSITYFGKDEQTRITAVLSCIERAIQQTEALIAKQQRIKTGLMHDLLTKGIDEHGKIRSEATHEFKDSPLGKVPKGWDVKPLSQIADLQVGYAFKSSSFSEGGLRLLRGENVGYGKPDWKDTRYIPERLAEGFSDYVLRDGDLVIGMDRTFTKSGVKISKLENQDVPSLLVQRVGRFQASGCDASFLTLLVSQNEYLFALRNKEKGMDIPHLSKTEILSPLVRVPSEFEQKRSAKRGGILSEFIRSLHKDLAKLLRLKAGLMLGLLTGGVPIEPLTAIWDDREAAV